MSAIRSQRCLGIAKDIASLWTFYLSKIEISVPIGENGTPLYRILYPTHLIAVETPDHYIFDLIGAGNKPTELAIRQCWCESADYYMNSGLAQSAYCAIQFSARNLVLSGGGLWGERPDSGGLFRGVVQRDEYFHLVDVKSDNYKPVSFAKSGVSVHIARSLFVARENRVHRSKRVLFASVFSKDIKPIEAVSEFVDVVEERLMEVASRPIGVDWVPIGDPAVANKLDHLANLFLQGSVRETTIGEFLRCHPEICERAFKAKRVIHEQPFSILDKEFDDADRIIPDIMLQRNDGSWDICDLKTALIGRSSLTKGERRRRRFIDVVNEGVAQLGHYKQYFSVPAHAKWVKEQFGIEVVDPQLILVVGCRECWNADFVKEAMRTMRRDVSIIDYDTLCSLAIRD